MSDLFFPPVMAAVFVAGCATIHALRSWPDEVQEVLEAMGFAITLFLLVTWGILITAQNYPMGSSTPEGEIFPPAGLLLEASAS